MKRILALFSSICMILLLTGCLENPLQENTVYNETTIHGQDAIVLFDQGTLESGQVSIGSDVYTFSYHSSGLTTLTMTLHYPDGSVYQVSSKGIDAEVENHDASADFPEPQELRDAIDEAIYLQSGNNRSNGPSLFVGLLLLAVGLWHLLFPKNAWSLYQGWLMRDELPSDGAILAYRICGGAAAVAGFGIVFFYLVSVFSAGA